MKATMLYGPRDVRFEERPDPAIVQPTDAIIRVLGRVRLRVRPLAVSGRAAASTVPRRWATSTAASSRRSAARSGRSGAGQFVVGSFATSDNTCPHCRHGYQSSCVQREFMSEAQAPLLRVPLADGTLVATDEVPSDDLLPSLLDRVRRARHRLVRRRRGRREARCDRRRGRRRRRRPARRALGEADGRRAHHRDEPSRHAPGARARVRRHRHRRPSAATRASRASRS